MNYKLRVIGHVDEIGNDKRTDPIREPISTSEIETLINTPIKELSSPLAVNSSILGEVIYLCPSEESARQIEAETKVAYTPEEIAALSKASKRMNHQDWIVFLKSLHLAKKTFLGSRIQA
jgi:hypothetical protein